MKTQTAEHTPGRWAAEQHSGQSWSVVVRDGGKMDGATIAHQIFQSAEANARLIAAAPELLEALELVVNHFELPASKRMATDSDVWASAKAAIEKATFTKV